MRNSAESTPLFLDEYRFDEGDVFQGMGGDYWIVTARLWNFDAVERSRLEPYGEAYDITEDHHRREYELTSLDPRDLAGEKHRLHEHDLASHFQDASAAEAREHYRRERPDEDLVTDGGVRPRRDISARTAIGECDYCGGNADSLLGGEHIWKCSEIVTTDALKKYIDDLRHNSERRSSAAFDAETADQIADELEEMIA